VGGSGTAWPVELAGLDAVTGPPFAGTRVARPSGVIKGSTEVRQRGLGGVHVVMCKRLVYNCQVIHLKCELPITSIRMHTAASFDLLLGFARVHERESDRYRRSGLKLKLAEIETGIGMAGTSNREASIRRWRSVCS
jgi:hypothetical protein